MSLIEQIASKHLGKAGDGTIVKPYVTPDFIDKTLLVPVPRVLNRTQYDIDEANLPFVGIDVWNAYEFSALTNNGFPVVGHVKIVYGANSTNIVESKSLKLYLNSFNMCKLGDLPSQVITTAKKIIEDDLCEILGPTVSVNIFIPIETHNGKQPVLGQFRDVDTLNTFDMKFDKYNEAPELLTSMKHDSNKITAVYSANLRSNCRVTNQPDWGDVYIYMLGKETITSESILQYLVSMRNENHFHEEICECIYKRLHSKFNPEELFVACLYTRRGGIDINPVRASSSYLMIEHAKYLIDAHTYTNKMWRQ